MAGSPEALATRGKVLTRALTLAAALAVVALQGLAIARQAVTSDEAYHTLAGFEADRYGRNGLNLEHPPLLKMVAALPFLAAPQPLAPPTLVSQALGLLPAVFTTPGAEARIRLAGRTLVACLFGLPFLAVAFLLGREVGGTAAGAVLALVLGLDFSVFPLLPLVYADALAALGSGLTLLAAARFLRCPGWVSAALLGLALGLAMAGKYTGLLLLPTVAGALLLAPGLRGAWRRRLLCAAVVLALAWGGVEATYAAANRRYEAAYGRETLRLYCANRATIVVEDRLQPFARPLLAVERRDPRAAQWLAGVLATAAQNSLGVYPACNFGRMHSRGLWWYFPLLLLVKTPLPLLAASVLALAVPGVWARRAAAAPEARGAAAPGAPDAAAPDLARRRFAWLLAATAAVYLAAAMSSNYNAGLRHLLPILPLLYLPAALAVARRPRLAVALLAALAAESFALAPTWLSSTNSWWLGDRDPLRFALALDNLYYHQNLIALREAVARRAAARRPPLPFHVLDPNVSTAQLDAYLGAGAALSPASPLSSGWYAVGASAEVVLPAILAASPEQLYGYARYQAIAKAWTPLVRAIAARGEDYGYVAGTFHLYRLP